MQENTGARRRSALAGLSLLFAVSCCTQAAAAQDLLVFAAASTAEVINAAAARFATDTGIKVRASYASSGALARQIEQGTPADLYLSANTAWMSWAEGRRLLQPDTITPLFGNRLVLIAPKDSRAGLAIRPGFPLLAALGDSRLAIADPAHVPAGAYARAALRHLNVWDAVAGRTARAPDVRAALALVERGEAPLGIVYRTDAMQSDKVRIVDSFPEASHPPIVYTLAVVGGRETGKARRFYDFLRSQAAAAIVARYGFDPP